MISLGLWVSIITSVGSLVLSGALVYFYFDMRNIQQEQAAIARRQTEIQQSLAEQRHKPVIEVSDRELEGDEIFLYLSNFGDGPAIDLRVTGEIRYELSGETITTEHSRELSRTLKLDREIGSSYKTLGSTLESGVEHRSFSTIPLFDYYGSESGVHSFRELLEAALADDIERLGYTVRMEYDDIGGETYSELLLMDSWEETHPRVLSEGNWHIGW